MSESSFGAKNIGLTLEVRGHFLFESPFLYISEGTFEAKNIVLTLIDSIFGATNIILTLFDGTFGVWAWKSF